MEGEKSPSIFFILALYIVRNNLKNLFMKKTEHMQNLLKKIQKGKMQTLMVILQWEQCFNMEVQFLKSLQNLT